MSHWQLKTRHGGVFILGKLPGEAGQAGLLESSLLIIYEHNHYINSSFKILYLILLADVFVTF